jgi:hypothetical protein
MRRFCAAIAVSCFLACWVACSGEPDDGLDYPLYGLCYYSGGACRSVEDCCPFPREPQCGKTVCENNRCVDKISEGKEFKSQVRGDCQEYRCNSQGRVVPQPAQDDTYDDGLACTRDICNGTHPESLPLPKGPSPNGSTFCNPVIFGANELECLEDAHCGDGSRVCSDWGRCVPLFCTNGAWDFELGETDWNCGGPCDGCQQGRACNSGADCVDGVCSAEEKNCVKPTCHDGVKNYPETGVDCGTTECEAKCDDGEGCRKDDDCKSISCFAGKCQPPTCDDLRRNGDEEHMDCGGSRCPPCE